ncbi:MAG: metal-dependent transcriptional regulator [Promethearchaeia archaeon]
MESNDIHESYEDYLKAIYLISKNNRGGWVSNSEIAQYLDVKPSSVSSMLHKLKDNGLIFWKPRKSLRLTKKGKKIAKNMMKKYNLLKEFFFNILEIKDKALIKDLSCRIEHHLTPEVSEALQNLSPKVSP